MFSLFVLGACNNSDNHTNWAPHFLDNHDPFGTAIFRDLVIASDPGHPKFYDDEMIVYKKDDLQGEEQGMKHNFLYVTCSNDPIDTTMIWKQNENGYSTIVAASQSFILEDFAEEVEKNKGCLTSVITNLVTQKKYNYPTQMCKSRVFDNPVDEFLQRYIAYEEIATIDSAPVAIRYIHPNGSSLIFVSMPLLFTNYGALYEENAELIIDFFRIAGGHSWYCFFHMDEKNKEAAYYETSKIKSETNSESSVDSGVMLRDLIEYAIIGVFIGFLLFFARRRERIIPVMEKPQNKSIDFAKQISKNYMWKEEYGVILRKKFVVFIDTLQEKTNINLNDLEHFSSNIATLEKLTHENRLKLFFQNLFKIHENKKIEVSYEEMRYYIIKMNLIISKLK